MSRATILIGLCLALSAAAGLAATAAPEVRLILAADGAVRAASLPPVLGDVEVERHLLSGLTTTFVLRAAALPEPALARVEIRYELWDELFLIEIADGRSGEPRRLTRPSRPALDDWWRGLEVTLLGPGVRNLPSRSRVTLDLIPFSRGEQDDARRWLAESIGRAGEDPRPGAAAPVTRAIGALIATSIQRRSARSWSWRVTIEEEGGQ